MNNLSWIMPTNEKYNEVNLSTSVSTLCRDLADYNNISEMQSISKLQELKEIFDEKQKREQSKKNKEKEKDKKEVSGSIEKKEMTKQEKKEIYEREIKERKEKKDFERKEKKEKENSRYEKLCKADKIRSENSEKLLEELMKKTNIIPDKWQSDFINELDTDNSVIVFAPTGSGKTYTSVKAFMSILNTDKTVVYIAPYFYLAFQMLANVNKLTGKDINFITENYKSIQEKSNIFIGTSKELYAFFQKDGKKFDIGIFDEIHSISETYDYDISKYYSGLVSLCKEKIIGLSATVAESDVDNLVKYLSDTSKIPKKNFKTIVNNVRSVPLYKNVFTENGIEPLTDKPFKYAKKSNEEYIRLFIELRKQKKTPSIFFQKNNIVTWKDYKSFIEFVEKEEENENIIRKHAYKFNESIIELVKEYDELDEKLNDCSFKDGKGSKDGLNIDRVTKQKETILEKFSNIRDIVIQSIQKDLVRKIQDFISGDFSSNYIDDTLTSSEKTSMKEYFIYHYDKLLDKDLVFNKTFYIPCFTHTYRTLIFMEETDFFRSIPEKNNPFFVFGDIPPDLSIYKILRDVAIVNEEINKKRKVIKLLSKGEGILDVDVMNNIVSVFIRGLEFGIGILITSVPFLLQIEMLRFLSNKYIGIMFASSDMAVGINYPLRSVVICSPDNNECVYPLSFRIQMEGRCGRRGKDKEGHIIYYNIGDLDKTERDLSSLHFPSVFDKTQWVLSLQEPNVALIYDFVEWIRQWKSNVNDVCLRYAEMYKKKGLVEKTNMEERFEVMTYFREWCKELHEYYYYCLKHNEGRALEIRKLYIEIRKFIQSLKVFSS
jgi:superfamily II DNA or RNA helicase